MVTWIPDPDNTSELIPRFDTPQDMGDYWELTGYTGKIGASPEMMQGARENDKYHYLFEHHSPVHFLVYVIIGIVLLAITCYIIYSFIAGVGSVIASLMAPKEATVKEVIPGCYPDNCPTTPVEGECYCPVVVSYPDGSTTTYDQCTGKICAESGPTTDWGGIAIWGIIAAVAVGGIYVVVKIIPPLLKKKGG